ncbi:MAG: alpha-hydroxy-acid oxidizing protein, partial [Bdellovibrio sp.]|nr:alpha-hydroxy-acid oxidizing protein [Bdellovibrio sp.]
SRLKEVGLSAIDVSGLGGTHWGRIEGARADNPCDLKALASKTFSNWGEPTTHIVINAKKILPRLEIWASGGVRSGLDAAKLIALGAQAVGYAQPALKAVLQSNEVLHLWMERQEFELRVALFCTGCGTPRELQQKEGVWTIIKT